MARRPQRTTRKPLLKRFFRTSRTLAKIAQGNHEVEVEIEYDPVADTSGTWSAIYHVLSPTGLLTRGSGKLWVAQHCELEIEIETHEIEGIAFTYHPVIVEHGRFRAHGAPPISLASTPFIAE